MPRYPGILCSSSGGAAPGLTIGTVGTATHSSSDVAGTTGYTFAAPTVDGGGKALIGIVFWNPNIGSGGVDMSALTPTFTLNGSSYNTLLALYMDNASGGRISQATVAVWTSPVSGSVVFQPGASISLITGGNFFYANVGGLHASPLGVAPARNTGLGTSQNNNITTGTAGSMVLALVNARTNGRGPITFKNATFQANKIGETSGAAAGDGTYAAAYQTGLAIDTYDAGADLTNSEASRLSTMAIELKAV